MVTSRLPEAQWQCDSPDEKMYETKAVVVIVTVLAAIAVTYGHPTVIDIADLDTIRRLELEEVKNDNNIPQELIMREKNEDEDVSGIKNNWEDSEGPEYLQPDWSAQGSVESDEQPERLPRSVGQKKRRNYGPPDDEYLFDSDEWEDDHDFHHDHHHGHPHDYDHDHKYDHDHDYHHSFDDRPERPLDCSPEKEKKKETVPNTETSIEPVVTSTVSPVAGDFPTPRPPGRINIDTRLGEGESNVRRKRMAWNVARPAEEFEDDTKPVKMRWSWDDQKPEIVPPVYDGYGTKPKIFLPSVNVQKPCKSKLERRDRHGRCRPAFA